jgi:outer membrane protein TolC
MTYRTYGIWAAAAALVAGCVGPGGVDNTALRRYQAGLVRHGALHRAEETAPLGLMRPMGEAGVPELQVRQGTAKVLDPQGILVERQVNLIDLSLEQAVLRALTNSPEIRVASFDPGIARQELIKAAAAFDPTLYGSFEHNKEDKKRTPIYFGVPEQQWRDRLNVGIKQRTVTGAEVKAEYELSKQETRSPQDKEYEQLWSLTVKQPLLRDAWSEVNLATVRVARINRDMSDQAFRDKVEQTVGTVVTGYWNLHLARRNVEIQQWLLTLTEETLGKVKARGEMDATDVHIKQTEAALESRRAALFRAQKAVLDAQDKLARTLDDRKVNLLDDYVLVPTTPLADAPLHLSVSDLVVTALKHLPVVGPELDLAHLKAKFNVSDQLATALKHSPLLAQARMAVASADISVDVANNQLLPRLDLGAGATIQGLGTTVFHSNEQIGWFNYISYNVSLTYEYPLGNREAESNLAKAKLQKAKAVATMQDLATQVAVVVRERVRLVRTGHMELRRQRAAVEAFRAQLAAMEVTEKEMGKLTPEWLSLKLSTQEALAAAQAAEVQATVDYNNAMINLAQVTGTVLYLLRVRIDLPAAIGQTPWPDRP